MRWDDVPFTPYKIYQQPGAFSYGSDSLMLLTFSEAKGRVVDLGAGTGILTLTLVHRPMVTSVDAVEIQDDVAGWLETSVTYNGLEEKVRVHSGDVLAYAKAHPASADTVVMNPPYFQNVLKNADRNHRQSRHHEGMEPWIEAASRLLSTGGMLELVQRPDHLSELIVLLERHRLAPKRIQFYRTATEDSAKLLTLSARKDGGVGLKVLPDYITHDEEKRPYPYRPGKGQL